MIDVKWERIPCRKRQMIQTGLDVLGPRRDIDYRVSLPVRDPGDRAEIGLGLADLLDDSDDDFFSFAQRDDIESIGKKEIPQTPCVHTS